MPFLLVSVLLLFLVACDDESPDATSTSVPGTSGTSSPTTPLPVTATPSPIKTSMAPVRWVNISVLDLTSAMEETEPFRDIKQTMGIAGQPLNWGVYLVEGAGEPAQVYSTPRWLTELSWDG